MIRVDNCSINATMDEILQVLRAEVLAETHNSYFRDIKHLSNGGILTNCPIHKNGQERKPSCGSNDDGVFHCFTCGMIMHIAEVVSVCFGHYDGGEFGKIWLKKKFKYDRFVELEPLGELSLTNKPPMYISEDELATYRYTHPYMYKRKLTDELIEQFDVGVDENFRLTPDKPPIETITFPVRDRNGRCLFVARRATEQKLFHYPTDVEKPIYGVYELYQHLKTTGKAFVDELVICESIFNALTCWRYGVPGVALLGTGTKTQYPKIARLPAKKLLLGLDPDDAGMSGEHKIINAVTNIPIEVLVVPVGKDINDLTKDEFDNLERIKVGGIYG